MAGPVNYTTDTAIDPVTGKTVVTITVAGPQSQVYQQSWLSDTPQAALPVVSNAPNAAVTNPVVSAQAAIAGPVLQASVAAMTATRGNQRIATPKK